MKGRARRVGRGAGLDPGVLRRGQTLAQLERQPRLADPRLAEDEHAPPLTPARCLPLFGQRRQLGLATGKGRQASGRGGETAAQPAGAHHAHESERLVLDRRDAGILDLERPGHEALRRGGDQQRIGSGGAARARGEVRHVAECDHPAGGSASDLADHDLAGVDADAHRRPDPVLALQRFADVPEGVNHLQAGTHRALRVVLVRLRVAEVREQPVDQVLRDVALPALDDGRRCLLHRAHDPAQILRVELPRERARTDEVARQERELSPLGRGYRRIEAVAGRPRIGAVVAVGAGAPAVELPRAVAHHQSILVEQPIERRRQTQRVAAARVVQRARDAVTERLRREATREPGRDVLHRQRAELHLRAAFALEQAFAHGEERMVVGERLRPVRHDDEELRAGRASGELEERVDGGGVAPLQILEHENERLLRGERLHGFGELEQAAFPARYGRASTQALDGRVVHPPRKLQQPAGRATRQRRDDVVTPRLVAQPAQQVEDRRTAFAAPVQLQCLTARAADAVGAESVEELVEERRFSRAGFARDQDDLTLAAACARRRLVQGRLLGVAPDEDRRGDAGLDREPVAAARDGGEEAIRLGTERRADLADRHAQHARADRRPGPDGALQLRVRHEPVRMLGEVQQHGRRLRPQRALAAAMAKPTGASIELEVAEGDHRKWGLAGAAGRRRFDAGRPLTTLQPDRGKIKRQIERMARPRALSLARHRLYALRRRNFL